MHRYRIKPDTTRWRPDFASLRYPFYITLADQIENAIRSGLVRTGEHLPTQREIADELGIHLNTVNAAFKEAARRGLIEARSRRGTVVIGGALASADRAPLAYRTGGSSSMNRESGTAALV